MRKGFMSLNPLRNQGSEEKVLRCTGPLGLRVSGVLRLGATGIKNLLCHVDSLALDA